MTKVIRFKPPEVATHENWPPDYVNIYGWRQQQLRRIRTTPGMLQGALAYYRDHPAEFICHWVDTYDPRKLGTGDPARMPFVLFQRQAEMVDFLQAMLAGQEGGLIEKCRDAGATWVCAAFSVWLWRFRTGASIGWGSRKEALVDRLGDPDSIFEKMRMLIRELPREFWPKGFSSKDHMPFMRIMNPENDSIIAGEAGNNIGRGGRSLIYFKDESAHYERPELIEAALADNTNVQIDISSVAGLGNVFHRRREAGKEWSGGPAHKGMTNVFVMDWSDHPAKTQDWYDTRKNKSESEGLAHVFAQEVDRDYSAAVEGVIIPAAWVKSAIGAAENLGIDPSGKHIAGLDVADDGPDKNALAHRNGIELVHIADWGDRDVGVTTRRAIGDLEHLREVEVQYDSVGVGAGVKSEANRLEEENKLRSGMRFISWSAGARVLSPDDRVIPDDDESPLNKDFYANLKAQAWWQLRLRFERTHKAITEGAQYPVDDLISISPDLPQIRDLQKELSQATASRSTGSLKLVVDKNPPGTRSPNLADAVVMAFWPVPRADTYDIGAFG